jgi:hypothetical protein
VSPDAGILSFCNLLLQPADGAKVHAYATSLDAGYVVERCEYLGSVSVPSKGVDIALKEGEWLFPRCSTDNKHRLYVEGIHFHSEGHEGHKEYLGKLLDDIRFGVDRHLVRAKLGSPSASGGGNVGPGGKEWPYWDRYDFKECCVRLEYSSDRGRLVVATLMLPPEYLHLYQ